VPFAFALYDQLVVDRAFGGDFKTWDVLVDPYPGAPHKAFKLLDDAMATHRKGGPSVAAASAAH
jgi:hypothetical protein